MSVSCCVDACDTKASNGFHNFPSDKERCFEWMNRTKTLHYYTENISTRSWYKVCNKHFKENDYEYNVDGKKRLRKTAVPSQFLPGPLTLKLEHTYDLNSKIRKQRVIKNPEAQVVNNRKPSSSKQVINVSKLRNDSSRNRERNEICLENDDNNICFDLNPTDGETGNMMEVHVEKDKVILNGLLPKISNNCNNDLEKKLKDCKVENAALKSKMRYTQSELENARQKLKKNKCNDKTVLEYLGQTFNKEQLTFLKMQMRNSGRKPHGRRFKLDEKNLCLVMYKQSPKHYRNVMKPIFKLPSKRTIGRHNAYLHFDTGIDPKLFKFIEDKVKTLHKIDTYCILSWDEVALKSHLDYNQSNDLIDGFVDLSHKRRPEFATHSLAFMIRGMNKPFKQSVAFYYTHGLTAPQLAELVLRVGRAVLHTGLTLIGSTCDQVNLNASAIHILIDPICPRTQQTGEILQYEIDEASIIHCFDAPHLIKVIRNNLLTKNLRHCISNRFDIGTSSHVIEKEKTYLASWDDISDVYHFDLQGTERHLPKITDEHITPIQLKMKVCVATQVFSATYGNVMLTYSDKKLLKRDLTGTAQLLFFFNDVFDSINGSGFPQCNSLKGSINEDSIHFVYWNYALLMMSKMNYVDKKTGKINNRSSVLLKFMSTIKGYIELTKICLNLNMEDVCLRNADQDGLENLFCCIKSCNNVTRKPISTQFKTGYATMMVNHLSSANSLSANCEQDYSIPLLNDLHDFLLKFEEPSNFQNSEIENCESDTDIIMFDPDFSKIVANVAEVEMFSKTSSAVCRKMLEVTDCRKCINNLQTNSPQDLITHGDNLENIFHNKPTENFIRNFNILFYAINEIIPHFCSEKSLKKKILSHLESVPIEAIGCPKHDTELIIKLKEFSVHQAITSFCQNINRILSGKITMITPNANHMEELAFSFKKKRKDIGKYSDVLQSVSH